MQHVRNLQHVVPKRNITLKLFYTDSFVLPLPENHRFPMSKYALLRQKLLQEAVVTEVELHVPPAATDSQLLRVHAPEYLEKLMTGNLSRQEILKIGFPWSPQLVERSRRSSGATIQACYTALNEGFSANLAGGTHHAFYDRGEGFCLFNDSVVAARELQASGKVERVLIVDTDVHQGNGTAALVREDPTIFSFSIHGARNYPIRKEISDLDIPLEDNAGDQEFLDKLDRGLIQSMAASKPDLVIYLSGADAFHEDKLGRLKLSHAGLSERDRMIYDRIKVHGLPVVVTMGGGYANHVEDTVQIHFQSIMQGKQMLQGSSW
jgi:acetoin utilization deacetylase AcuC-like enzyme